MTSRQLPFIQSLQINKVRHLKDLTIRIDNDNPRHLILTGPNGCGKTSVLRFLKEYLEGIPNNSIIEIENWREEVKISEQEIVKLKKTLSGSGAPRTEQAKLTIQNQINSFESHIITYQMKIDAFDSIVPEIANLARMVELYHKGEFIIVFFGAKRFSQISPADGPRKTELPAVSPIDTDDTSPGSTNLSGLFLQYLVNQESRAAHMLRKGDKAGVAELEKWMENLTNRFRVLFQNDGLKLEYDIDEFDFTIEIPGREPFRFVDNQLSDGFSAVIHIIAELLLRMEKKAAGRYDMPGIVMVDEIETHLHIELQKQILPFLTDFFPNIQFITTTHSPFVLTSLADSVVFDLESRKRWERLAPLSASNVVEGYFESDLYSVESKRMIGRYAELASKKNREPEEEMELGLLRKQLDLLDYEDAPELVAHYRHLKAKEGRK